MMYDDSLSDVSSILSDTSYLSDFEDECQSFNFDLSNGSPINLNNFRRYNDTIYCQTSKRIQESLKNL